MFTVKEIAVKLNCSTQTVYNLVESGKLGHHRCPGIRISEAQLLAYLQETERGPGSRQRYTGPRPIKLKHLV
jgi:excisionase family DNA binding protein